MSEEVALTKKGLRTKQYLALIDEYILTMMMKGYTNLSITNELMEHHGLTESNAKYRIDQVHKRIRNSDNLPVDQKVAKYKEMYSELYRKALDNEEYRTANAIMDSIVKLEGLLTTKVEAKVEMVTYEIKFD